jgi:hypothetical protein
MRWRSFSRCASETQRGFTLEKESVMEQRPIDPLSPAMQIAKTTVFQLIDFVLGQRHCIDSAVGNPASTITNIYVSYYQ